LLHKLRLAIFFFMISCLAKPAFAELRNGMDADFVIGQPDFFSKTDGTSQQQMGATEAAVTVGNRLIVGEWNNRRVVIFNTVPTNHFPKADIVLGKPNFNTRAALAASARDFNAIVGLGTDGQRLFIAEFSYNRILIYNNIPNESYAPADVVVGQSSFAGAASNNGGISAATVSNPTHALAAGGRFFIADYNNRRVLGFNKIPTANGTPADFVLGQPNFTTSTAGTSRTIFRNPQYLAYDGQRFYVADAGNNRVLIYNTLPTTTLAPADVVVGQPDFTSSQPGSSSSQFNNPQSIYVDGQRLFVADSTNQRVLVWKTIPTKNGVAADFVLGQPNFESTGSGIGPDRFNGPSAIYGDGNNLYVGDFTNNRVVVFNLGRNIPEVRDPQFTQGKAVVGKVFEDKNANGRQDKDEKGIEGVKIASDTGIYAITDEDGKYHFPFIQIGQRVLKIDESTLPGGSMITTESPRKVIVTKGILTKTSFGAKLPEGESVSEVKIPKGEALLKVSLSQDPAALQPRLSVSARQEDDKVIFTIDCNYFLLIDHAELKLFDEKHNPFKTIQLKKPLPYEYEMPFEDLSFPRKRKSAGFPIKAFGDGKGVIYYQLSVFNAGGREDRTNLGEIILA
jgi:hypothetical protein